MKLLHFFVEKNCFSTTPSNCFSFFVGKDYREIKKKNLMKSQINT